MPGKRASRRYWIWRSTVRKEAAKALVVTGCLAQRYQEEIRQEIQEVDAVLGTASYDEIADALDEVLRGMPIHRFRISTVFLMWMRGVSSQQAAHMNI